MPIDRDGDGPPLRRPESKVSLALGEGRGGDLRATPFTDDVFTDDYYGRRAGRAGGSRSYSVLIGVTLGVVIAAGAGWYFLKGSGLTFTPGQVGFIKADPTPYKIRPDDPGGLQVENQGILVYDRVAKGTAPARVENLLPPAEEPKAPPAKPVEAAKPAEGPTPGAAAIEPAKPEVAKPDVAKTEVAKPEVAKPGPAAAPKEKTRPAAAEADPLAAAVAAATGGRSSATGPIAVTPPVAAPSATAKAPAPEAQIAAAVPASPPPASPAPVQGTAPVFQVQLASVLSEQAALAEWGRTIGKHKDLLGGFTPAVTKADLGEKGVFYRLRAGPLADKAAADALCASLAAVNVGCIAVRP
ncbi:MAG: hypothetical protein EXQ84_04235 [Rhodospirillaceae bacterium]|nr:hypothetical protein [Rhodospirillaceae bacterium]